jgi:hypothetical protein
MVQGASAHSYVALEHYSLQISKVLSHWISQSEKFELTSQLVSQVTQIEANTVLHWRILNKIFTLRCQCKGDFNYCSRSRGCDADSKPAAGRVKLFLAYVN